MKKMLLVIVLAVVLAVPAMTFAAKKGPSTPDKTYTNSDYRFRLNYPGAWNYEESEKVSGEVDAGYGMKINVGKMAGMPKMCNVKFAEDPKSKNDDDPFLNLVVMTWQDTKGERSKKGDKKEGKAKKEKKEECVIVEQRSVTWAGQKAMVMTTRCPETKKVKIGDKKQKATVWRYMTAVNMKRGQDMYNLVGEMLCTVSGDKLCDDMNDKGKAAEFDPKLRSARDKMIATTKFTK